MIQENKEFASSFVSSLVDKRASEAWHATDSLWRRCFIKSRNVHLVLKIQKQTNFHERWTLIKGMLTSSLKWINLIHHEFVPPGQTVSNITQVCYDIYGKTLKTSTENFLRNWKWRLVGSLWLCLLTLLCC